MPTNRPTWKPLHGYGAFTRVLAHGKVFSSGSIRCFVIPQGKAGGSISIGFGVTRAVRGAVGRNRIRRLLRESVRLHQHTIVAQGKKGHITAEIVLMYTGRNPAGASSIRLADMENSVAQVLTSAAAYCEAGNRRAGDPAD